MKENKNGKKTAVIISLVLVFAVVLVCAFLALNKNRPGDGDGYPAANGGDKENESEYMISDHSLDDFDLCFLKLENKPVNKIYSPLSIKYALKMLEEAADGESKSQIQSIVGGYNPKTYPNSDNMSFANGFFIRDSYKNSIKDDYINTLKNKFAAEVFCDSFQSPDNINSWVSEKTLHLIENLFDEAPDDDFYLINALAIDMEWVKEIQIKFGDYGIEYSHEDFYTWTTQYGYRNSDSSFFFAGSSQETNYADLRAAVNKYDIVNDLGEDKIREIVGAEYKKWLEEAYNWKLEYGYSTYDEAEKDVDKYLDTYIEEIKSNYNRVDSYTDFYFYDDENVKVFAKDLKEYNGVTLQYVGIMPKSGDLQNYIDATNAKELGDVIANLKSLELENFKDGVITVIKGYIPTFQFDYELDLIEDLKSLGIADIFDGEKANLSNLTSAEAVISKVAHKANIEFSNEGIKAAAVTFAGGKGGPGFFDYLFDVPVEEIDLTFDNPYLFLIRDKDSGEVWFAGTVYEPDVYEVPQMDW